MDAPTSRVRAEVLLEHTRWMQDLARALVGAREADDVVQEAWVAALEHPREVRSVRAWLAGVLRNVVHQQARSEGRRRARETRQEPREPAAAAGEVVTRAELHQRVVRAVLALEEPSRTALLLRYFDGLSAEDIARRLALPSTTVKSRLHTALERLRARLEREGANEWRSWCLALAGPGAARSVPPEHVPGDRSSAASGERAAGRPSPSPAPSSPLPSCKGGPIMSTTLFLKTSLTVTTLLGAGLGGPWLYRQLAAAPRSLSGANPPSAASSAGITIPGETRQAREVAPPQERDQRQPLEGLGLLLGRVLDSTGQALPGAPVFVGGRPNPFPGAERLVGLRFFQRTGGEDREGRRYVRGEPGEEYEEEPIEEGLGEWASLSAERLERHGAVIGCELRTDEEGGFRVRLPAGAGRLYIGVLRAPGVLPAGTGTWLSLPGTGSLRVELHASRIPTTEVHVWVTDTTTQERLPRFGGSLWRGERRILRWGPETSEISRTVELPAGESPLLRVEIESPLWARGEHEVWAVAGAPTPFEIRVRSGLGFHGEVRDALGRPVEGAFVFWGELLDLRGGSPFRPYETARVAGGVRTDAYGRFVLPGDAEQVSAWHPDHGPASARRQEAEIITLPPRGAVEGELLDEGGAPRVGAPVVLDRGEETTTDGEGRFHFASVEAGVHGLLLGERQFVGIDVRPGETLEVEPSTRVQVPGWSVTSGGLPFGATEQGGVVLGTGPVFSVSEWGLEGAILHSGALLPGRHLFMSKRGFLAVLDVRPEGPRSVELGSSAVTLRIGERELPAVYLLPEGFEESPIHRYWGERFFGERESPAVRFSPLRAGRYAVLVKGRGVVSYVDVAAGQVLDIGPETWLDGPDSSGGPDR